MMRTYAIPDTPLPFVNGEIAQVSVRGEAYLVSAIWGGSAGGRIYFWNPETKRQFMRELPDGMPGAYMIKTAADGRLYLGCGNGDLYRYDPAADRFEPLVRGAMNSITWGGCVTERHVVWSASPGHVGVYDHRAGELLKVFAPIDADSPTVLYGHTVHPAPDGWVLLAMNIPQARLVLLDPVTLRATSHTPEYLQGVGSIPQAVFLDAQTLGVMVGAAEPFLALIEYPSLGLIDRVPLPGNIWSNQRNVVIDGQFYALIGSPAEVWRFDLAGRRWVRACAGWPGEAGVLGRWGEGGICCLNSAGLARTWDTRTGRADEMQLDATGPMEAHAMRVCPEAGVIVGAPFINSRIWTIDLLTGEGRDRGRAQIGSGQINQIAWDAGRGKAYLSSYTQAALSEFDPAAGGAWPENPRHIASAKPQGQMRPKALAFDGRFAWKATSPNYGTLGGALIRIDPQTEQVRVWRNLVADQTINGLVLDVGRRRVYCSSEIYADCESCPPTQTTAQVVAFDMDGLGAVARAALPEGEPSAMVHVVLGDGRVLVGGGATLYAWDAQGGGLEALGPCPKGLREVQYDGRGRLWAVSGGQVGRLEVGRPPRFIPLVRRPESVRFMQVVGDELFYAAETNIHREALPPA